MATLAPGHYNQDDVNYWTPAGGLELPSLGLGFGGVFMPKLAGLWGRTVKRFEAVPTKVADLFKEYDRTLPREMATYIPERGTQKLNRLADKIVEQGGIVDPLIMDYYAPTKEAIIREGNHRLAAAKQLGLDYVPVRVNRSELVPNVYGLQRHPVSVPGVEHSSGRLLPSEIGIEGAERISPLRMRLLKEIEPLGFGE